MTKNFTAKSTREVGKKRLRVPRDILDKFTEDSETTVTSIVDDLIDSCLAEETHVTTDASNKMSNHLRAALREAKRAQAHQKSVGDRNSLRFWDSWVRDIEKIISKISDSRV